MRIRTLMMAAAVAVTASVAPPVAKAETELMLVYPFPDFLIYTKMCKELASKINEAGKGILKINVLPFNSIGMFKLQPGARTAAVVIGVITLAFNLVNGIVTHHIITKPMIEKITETADEQMVNAIQIGIKIGFAIQSIPLFYYLLMIFILTRRSVVGAFVPDNVQSEIHHPTLDDPERNTL